MRLLPADEFPRVASPEGTTVTVDAEPFAEALRQVIPAASRDDARPILTGVLIMATTTGIRLVATDSYRLAVRDLDGVGMLSEGQKVLVGARGLNEVQRVFSSGKIDVTFGEREVRFANESRSVTTRLIEGDFPNYEQLIPSGYPNRLTVSRDALEEAVRLMQIVGEGREGTPVRLAMSAVGTRALGHGTRARGRRRVHRREVRGHGPHRRVQPAVPPRRPARDQRRRGGAREHGPTEARHAAQRGTPGVHVSPDAGSHQLTCALVVSG